MLSKEIIQVLNDNPDLPVYAWVNGEVCEDDCHWWASRVTNVEIREFTKVPFEYGYMGTDWVFKDEQEDAIDYLINTEEYLERFPNGEDDIDEAVEAAVKYLDSFEYTKAIFLYIDTV